MNLLNKNINPETLQKISLLLNSKQGEELKTLLKNIDKEKLIETFGKMNVSAKDMSQFNEKVKNLTEEEIINALNKFKGERSRGK